MPNEPLPTNIGFGTVVGRFGSAPLIAGDADGLPDFSPATGLTVTFTPSTAAVIDATASPAPVTIEMVPIVCGLDTQGYLVGGDGQRGVKLIATDDTDINPSGWTYLVTFLRAGAKVAAFRDFSISLPQGVTKDIALTIPVPSSSGVSLNQAQAAEAAAVSAASRASASAAAAAATLANAAVISGGVLTVAGLPVAPDQVSAAPLGARIVIPASEMVAAGGVVGVTQAHVSGFPVLTFARPATRLIDTFTRMDSATVPGAADTGQAWTAGSGTWGIASNRLYNPSAVNGHRLVIPNTTNDCDVSATIAVMPGAGSVMLMARWADASNYVWLGVLNTGVLQVGHVIAGTFSTLTTTPGAVVTAGSQVTLRAQGGALTALVGGLPVATATTTVLTGSVNAGIRNAGDTTGNFRIDDFSVSDNQTASTTVAIPAHWATFDVSILYTTLATGSGNVRWRYSERGLNLASGTTLALAPISSATSTALASGVVQRAYLGSGRPAPVDNLVAVGFTRLNSEVTDTLGVAVGLIAVEIAQNT